MIRERIVLTLARGLLIGLLGVVISFMPGTSTWEEDVGLGLLFKLRGQRSSPQEVVIVSINGQTGAQLGLGEEIPEWPRSLHADLIDRLKHAGVAVIAIDIFFKKARDFESDKAMANAIQRAGNVLLVAYLEQGRIVSGQETVLIERLIPPTDILADAALGVAPFVLPKVPVRVNRFWTFNGDNELISLPAAALQRMADPNGDYLKLALMAVEDDSILTKNGTDVQAVDQWLRENGRLRNKLLQALKNGIPAGITALQRQRLISLLEVYDSETYPYLNFYGPPGSVSTIPFQDIITAPPQELSKLEGKVVFVGYAGAYQPDQKDGFYTVFSQANGLDLSGVEIAATAFANLLMMETVSPLDSGKLITLLIAFGITITLLFCYLPGMLGIAVGLAAGGAYLYLVYSLFARFNLWLPWFVPLTLQAPLALILSLILYYRQMRRSREQLRELFGFYLPGDVIDHLAQNNEQPISQTDSAFGVCLASDAQNYTQMAEAMEPQALQVFLNRYYEILFAPVRARDGVVSDVIGDAMLAIWPSTKLDRSLQQKACEAALEIVNAIERSDLEPKLFTRIGLHAGELVMSHVGAIDHFEYRAVGDMINTASRIENLNKQLGTSILATREFVEDLQGILVRELGRFVVAGKQQPITVFEIAATSESATPQLRELHAEFAKALAAWHSGDKDSAYSIFKAILNQHPSDGPSIYYVRQYRERRASRKNSLG